MKALNLCWDATLRVSFRLLKEKTPLHHLAANLGTFKYEVQNFRFGGLASYLLKSINNQERAWAKNK